MKRAALVLLLAIGCSSSAPPSGPQTTGPSTAHPPLPAGKAAAATGLDASAPADRRCLPARKCTQWVGCALVARTSSGWVVEAADEVPLGLPARVGNGCTKGARCEAVHVMPPGTQCPPWTDPPIIEAPPYRCVLEGASCRRVAP
jgi:hypothetical protein